MEKLHPHVLFDIKADEDTLAECVFACCEAMEEIGEVPLDQKCAFAIRFSDDKTIQDLNKRFRQKDKPTNVLSFPDGDIDPETNMLYLGDIMLSLETVDKEAEEQNKDFAAHICHLVIHGVLHLCGYDHKEDEEAEKMENLEVRILAKLGIMNPYEQCE